MILLEQSLRKGEQLEDDVQPLEGAGSVQGENGIEERVPEGSERSEISAAVKESAEGYENVDVLRDESQRRTCEEAVVEDDEEKGEVQRTTEEPSPQDSEAVTPKEEQLAKQKSSEQEKLPQTDLTVDERRDDHVPEVQAAVSIT
ncbi:hypothetical protein CIB84_017488 [Bambusicola thoracicus]|uniref:Uncharacterized protein n=1 Tax=Bambusicola thoracicus TaxID=9083 RepID=A0A2P4S3S0_BAMTH|nr:hypothetical protein CIB84_017488 [Bambusicola thoracicus]